MIKVKDEAKEVLGQPGIPLSAAQRLTEKRTLAAPRDAPHQKTHSGCSGARKMRLSVTSNSKMRLSVECAFPHLGKRSAGSRKSALCPDGLTEKRTLRSRHRSERRSLKLRLMEKRTLLALGVAECAFRSRRRPGGVEPNPPPACGALWKMAQLGKCARATPPPGCGGGCAGTRRPRPGARPHGKTQSGQRASLMERSGPPKFPEGYNVVNNP